MVSHIRNNDFNDDKTIKYRDIVSDLNNKLFSKLNDSNRSEIPSNTPANKLKQVQLF